MKLTSYDIDLIIASLNYCNINKNDFVEHLNYQEQYDTASYCNDLDNLRQQLTEVFHKMIENDIKDCRIIMRIN